MRISKKFAKMLNRIAEKALNSGILTITVFIGGERFQVDTISCTILREKTKDIYNTCRTYSECADWFFLYFNMAELREAKISFINA